MATRQYQERGFTLIELMVSVVIAMVMMAGLYGVFLMQSRVQNAQSEAVESSEDLRIAAQIMQGELRLAREICWDSTNTRVIYRPLPSTVSVGACTSVDAANGSFELRAADSTHPTPYMCWDRPNDGGGCAELVRNLNAATGLQVTPTSNADVTVTRHIDLVSAYKDYEKKSMDWNVNFDVWPRN